MENSGRRPAKVNSQDEAEWLSGGCRMKSRQRGICVLMWAKTTTLCDPCHLLRLYVAQEGPALGDIRSSVGNPAESACTPRFRDDTYFKKVVVLSTRVFLQERVAKIKVPNTTQVLSLDQRKQRRLTKNREGERRDTDGVEGVYDIKSKKEGAPSSRYSYVLVEQTARGVQTMNEQRPLTPPPSRGPCQCQNVSFAALLLADTQEPASQL